MNGRIQHTSILLILVCSSLAVWYRIFSSVFPPTFYSSNLSTHPARISAGSAWNHGKRWSRGCCCCCCCCRRCCCRCCCYCTWVSCKTFLANKNQTFGTMWYMSTTRSHKLDLGGVKCIMRSCRLGLTHSHPTNTLRCGTSKPDKLCVIETWLGAERYHNRKRRLQSAKMGGVTSSVRYPGGETQSQIPQLGVTHPPVIQETLNEWQGEKRDKQPKSSWNSGRSQCSRSSQGNGSSNYKMLTFQKNGVPSKIWTLIVQEKNIP